MTTATIRPPGSAAAEPHTARGKDAVAVVFVVMNSAVPNLAGTGSGTGPAAVGWSAGVCTVNSAGNC